MKIVNTSLDENLLCKKNHFCTKEPYPDPKSSKSGSATLVVVNIVDVVYCGRDDQPAGDEEQADDPHRQDDPAIKNINL